jgi:hypothetical protein
MTISPLLRFMTISFKTGPHSRPGYYQDGD